MFFARSISDLGVLSVFFNKPVCGNNQGIFFGVPKCKNTVTYSAVKRTELPYIGTNEFFE